MCRYRETVVCVGKWFLKADGRRECLQHSAGLKSALPTPPVRRSTTNGRREALPVMHEHAAGHPLVTDARFPAYWLIDQRFDDLTPDELHLFTAALLWSVSNHTDGTVPERRLDRLPWRPDPRCASRLEALNLWRPSGDDWMILDFAKTQTSAAQHEAAEKAKRIDRERKAAQRAHQAAAAAKKDAQEGVSTRKSVGHPADSEGKESARASREEEDLPPASGFVSDDVKDSVDWPVAAVPGQRRDPDPPTPPATFAILERMKAEADRT